jgi:hypothetical protein
MIDVGRCGNLAFFARFPNPCGRVLCVHWGGSVHIVFERAKIFKGVITSATMRVAKKGDSGVAAPLEKSAPGAS